MIRRWNLVALLLISACSPSPSPSAVRLVDVFDSAAASIYGKVRATLEKKGRPMGPNDMLIAAHTLSLGLVLVSDNLGEFKRVRGLKLENWREA